MALPSRLVNTWPRRSGSPLTCVMSSGGMLQASSRPLARARSARRSTMSSMVRRNRDLHVDGDAGAGDRPRVIGEFFAGEQPLHARALLRGRRFADVELAADDFLRGVAEHGHGARVPARDLPAEVLGPDGFARL